MFIDIVKFSEYSILLTPTQIINSLSNIFGAYDECLTKYPLVTKIKLIGDIYMCAAGLFDNDVNPSEHAEQILNFGLDCIQAIERINQDIEASLSVRIGVHSGGPIAAGVLGTDKAVFDIFGDSINVALLIQSTDPPGKIQISQSTYDLISNLYFNIQLQGEEFLKRKEKIKTYLVSRIPQAAELQGSSRTTSLHLANTKSFGCLEPLSTKYYPESSLKD